MNKPHVHKDAMIHHANGGDVQSRVRDNDHWSDDLEPRFFIDWQYRIKPEREFPVTSIPAHQLEMIHGIADTTLDGYIDIANAAIKQHILDTESK